MAKVLVIGGGGREHAICWKLSQSPLISKIFVLPGSAEIGRSLSKCELISTIDVTNSIEIAKFCKKNDIQLAAIGPEAPLANGIQEHLAEYNIYCFGPSKMGAMIESDKSWSKMFMKSYGIPTAKFESFKDAKKAKDFIMTATFPALVVKASGLAAGKGVIVAETKAEACQAVDDILVKKIFGSAGDTIVIEEKLTGEEISVLAFVDNCTVKIMLPAQDHKRLKNNDQGPMTGGVGAYCPCPLINEKDLEYIRVEIIERALAGLKSSNIRYCGVLYAGCMLTPNGPKTLEFNCRFGDPETQVILPLLETDLYEIMLACCKSNLHSVDIKWKQNVTAVGVVMCSSGYPDAPKKNDLISGLSSNTAETIVKDDIDDNHHITFHCGTSIDKQGNYLTNGGRVLINVALNENLRVAAKEATKMCDQIKFAGSSQQYRTDIAQKAFKLLSLTYKLSGVDIKAGEDLVQRIKPLARGTNRTGVIGGLGGFGGLVQINQIKYKNERNEMVSYINPVIVERCTGIGSKLTIALKCKQYESIGRDLVALCTNELLCTGAEPIGFLDYVACGKLNVPIVAQIIKGIVDGCRETNCALLGGETAEMPALFDDDQYDLAGYCVGILEHGSEIPIMMNNKSTDYDDDDDDYIIKDGDLLIGLPSNGFHCSGFKIIDTIMRDTKLKYSDKAAFSENQNMSYGDEFLRSTVCYKDILLPFIRKYRGSIKAMVQIRNRGLLNNIEKIIPKHLQANINSNSWTVPNVYGWLNGFATEPKYLLEKFNCGIGMCFIVDKTNKLWNEIPNAIQIGKLNQRPKPWTDNKHPLVIIENFDQIIESKGKLFKSLPSPGFSRPIDCSSITEKIKSEFQLNINKKLIENVKSQRDNILQLTVNDDNVTTATTKHCIKLPMLGTKHNFDPILVFGADGVGTKLKMADGIGNHSTIGIDLVAMCVNDILCHGAQPLTFSNYYGCNNVTQNTTDIKYQSKSELIIQGIQNGCEQSGCTLIGGQTSENSSIYPYHGYDLAGFAMGICEYANLLPKTELICCDDIIIGLPSSGLHSNGFSLIHTIMETNNLLLTDVAEFSNAGRRYGEEFLTPTKIYVKPILPLLKVGVIKAMAHITGGGILENIIRVLPANCGISLDFRSILIPPVFGWLATKGHLTDTEMLRTYNCGIGMIIICSPQNMKHIYDVLHLEHGAVHLGNVCQWTMTSTSCGTPKQTPQKQQQQQQQDTAERHTERVQINGFREQLQLTQRILSEPKKRIGCLISGTGTNLQALIDATRNTNMLMGAEIVCVISNKENVKGLTVAAMAKIPCTVIDNKKFTKREDFDRKMIEFLLKHKVDFVCLAGFMRILSNEFVGKWRGKLINVHPSLLPMYKGLNAQRQALDDGAKYSGCTIHFVDEGVDTGQIIYQEQVPIFSDDTEATLTERIHKAEHVAYPQGLRMLVTGLTQFNY